MFAAILQDAWRQYRRRPVAVALSVAFGLVQIPLALAGDTVRSVLLVPLLVVGLLLELFSIAYLAGALEVRRPTVGEALAMARRAIGPGIRASLLKGAYAVPAVVIAILLLGPRDTGTLPAADQVKLLIGLIPLLACAWAFLAILNQRVVLDRERRVLRGAAVAHRVAAVHYPICLVVALLDAMSILAAVAPTGLAAQAQTLLALSLLDPFRIAMGNALFLRTRPLHVVERQARSSDQNRW